MNFLDILRRSSRTLKQAKMRTLLTAAALAVGGFTLTATLAAANGARAYGSKLIDTNFDPSSLIVSKSKDVFGKNGSTDKPQPYSSSLTNVGGGIKGQEVKELSNADLTTLTKVPGVQSVFEDYSTAAQFVYANSGNKYTATVAAYNPNVSHQFAAGGVSGNSVQSGLVVLPEDYVSLLGFKNDKAAIGQTITIQYRQILGNTKDVNYKVSGVLVSPSTLISGNLNTTINLNANDARSAYSYVNQGTVNDGRYLLAIAKVKNGNNPATLASVEQRLKNQGYGVESAKDAQATISQIVNVLQIIIIVFGLIALIASFFGVVNTQYISVLERTREIGLMKALGMSSSGVTKLFIVEASFIGFIGALMGSLAAIIAGEALNPWITKKLNFGSSHLLVFQPLQIVGLIVFLVVVATVAGLLPARKAARLDPIEALRTE